LKKYLCHDCAFVIGQDVQWWDTKIYGETCENKDSPDSAHRTCAILIDTDVPVPERTSQWGSPVGSSLDPKPNSRRDGVADPEPEVKPKLKKEKAFKWETSDAADIDV
jgi:hypothetical protein